MRVRARVAFSKINYIFLTALASPQHVLAIKRADVADAAVAADNNAQLSPFNRETPYKFRCGCVRLIDSCPQIETPARRIAGRADSPATKPGDFVLFARPRRARADESKIKR